jgi:hypothetical protein
MTGDRLSLSLDISEHLFKLTTESVRIRSNETQRYQTLESLIADRMGLPCILTDHPPERAREHLSAVPTKGDIRIDLKITKSSADGLQSVKNTISEGLGSEISLGDTISLVLFHYIIGQKSLDVLRRVGLEDSHACGTEAATAAISSNENIVPIR